MKKTFSIFVLFLAAACLLASPVLADETLLFQGLEKQTKGGLQFSYHQTTGKLRFLSVEPGKTLPGQGGTPEAAARGFLTEYGGLFGVTNQARELTIKKVGQADGRSFVKLQQVFQDVPVMAGELVVQTDALNNVLSVNGEVTVAPNLDVKPALTAGEAVQIALAVVSKHLGADLSGLTASEPELWIYNPALLGYGANRDLLVWRLEVTGSNPQEIRELVLVDAHTGNVAQHFTLLDQALNRQVYDKANLVDASLPGSNLVRSEGQAATGIGDVDKAYDYAGDTYNFYSTYHGRDSIDDSGLTQVITVRHCPDSANCPYENAFWNGEQMVFGNGLVADDVYAHEYTHGVTSYTSNLFYYRQSGAINEAFSDLWGEFVDLGNGVGDDGDAVRWKLGEDCSIGVIRDMKTPGNYSQPDKMSSTYYACGSADNGGVHTNSGVNNKAVYLIVDGGSFNGQTITGIGIDKTARIYYRVQDQMLTSGSDHADLYDLVQASCSDLTGTNGITSSDCQEVKKALDAVEMDQQPTACAANEAPICDSGVNTDVFFDDLESGTSKWTHALITGTDVWEVADTSSTWYKQYATSGTHNIYGYNKNSISDSYMAMTSAVLIPANAFLHFNHSHNFEAGAFDGGVVEYSNGGAWTDAGPLFLENGYNGTVSSSYGNPLGGRSAFVDESNGYISSRLDLSSLAGQNVKFRFRIGTDTSVDNYGWHIDDVRIYTCGAASQNRKGNPGTMLLLLDD